MVQVDPIKPTVKAPGTNLLTLKYDERLSNVAFKFNFRPYNLAPMSGRLVGVHGWSVAEVCALLEELMVGRCSLTL